MARVVRALDRHLRRKVAIKILDRRDSSTQSKLRFLSEAQTLAQLAHPNIVPLYDFGALSGGDLYVAMKEVRGRTLRAVLDDHRRDPTARSRERVLRTLVEVARALAYAHARGVVHRDLKPENVMVGPFGEAQVMDWGLARVLGTPDLPAAAPSDPEAGVTETRVQTGKEWQTADGMVLGTLPYMSPEQAAGRTDDVDVRTDVWALGVVLFELLEGRLPFQGANPAGYILSILHDAPRFDRPAPPELVAIARKCLEKDQRRRYASARELAEDFERFLDGRSVAAGPDPLHRRLIKFARRNPTRCGVTAAVFATALVLWAIFAWRSRTERAEDARRTVAESVGRADEALVGALGRDEVAQLEGEERRRELVRSLSAFSTAAKACDHALLVGPEDPAPIRARRLEIGRELGRIAVLAGDYTSAEREFQDLSVYGLGPSELGGLLQECASARTAERERHVERLDEILGAIASGTEGPSAIDGYVAEVAAYEAEPTAERLARAVGEVLPADRRGNRPRRPGPPQRSDPLLSGPQRDLVRFACAVMGGLPAEHSTKRLSAWFGALVDEDLAIEAGIALCRTGSPDAVEAIIDALEPRGFGMSARFRRRLRSHFAHVPIPGDASRNLVRFGLIRSLQGDSDGAIEAFEAALGRGDRAENLLEHLGVARYEAGRYPEACEAFTIVLRQRDSIPSWYYRSLARSARGQGVSAITDAEEILDRARHVSLGWLARAIGRIADGDEQGALEDLGHVLENDPEDHFARYWRGEALRGENRWIEAQAEYSAALVSCPEFSLANLGRARVLAWSRDYERAGLELRRGLEFATPLEREEIQEELERVEAERKKAEAAGLRERRRK